MDTTEAPKNPKRPPLLCSYCKKPGHYKSTCPMRLADIEAGPSSMPDRVLVEYKDANPHTPRYTSIKAERETMAPELPKLSNRYYLFCENLLAGMKQGEAYLAAGFDCKATSAMTNASKALRRDDVRVYMSLRRHALTNQTECNLEWWIKHNLAIIGETHGMKETPASRSAAVERLGRHLGAYQKDRQADADKRPLEELIADLPNALETLGVKDMREALVLLNGGKGEKKKKGKKTG